MRGTIDSGEVASFNDRGYLVVEKLFDATEIAEMKRACHGLIEKLDPEKERPPVFKTTGEQRGLCLYGSHHYLQRYNFVLNALFSLAL